jgi:twitching motility protein PilT
VFSTLHTNTSTQTIDRILDSFPADQQGQVRTQLSQVLKAVISMKLVERRDGKGRVAALEILRSSPKIANLIEKGKTGDLLEELETSVGYYRMQSMNHSLLALLVHGTITYKEAMEQSSDPEDLSLKLRKMFPNLAQEGDEVSDSDFAEIHELREFRRLYEEQEEKNKLLMTEKEEQVAGAMGVVHERDGQIRQLEERIEEMKQETERMRGDFGRLKEEAQQKIDKLMERIRDLNQRLQGGGGPAPAPDKKSGLFR